MTGDETPTPKPGAPYLDSEMWASRVRATAPAHLRQTPEGHTFRCATNSRAEGASALPKAGVEREARNDPFLLFRPSQVERQMMYSFRLTQTQGFFLL
jgi:hypothetical protein